MAQGPFRCKELMDSCLGGCMIAPAGDPELEVLFPSNGVSALQECELC